ncbi:patatin family protein [Erysipelotrichaceae bacterium RD49]|nr:patatin family protein [Erysipelotrichaceae bacterium RD49]
MDNVGLVVEGGGTKIAYSAGVLKCFLEHHIYFPYSVGISSGAEVLLAYVSRQIRRLEVTAIDAASQKGTIGLIPLIKEGGLFGLEATNAYIEKHAPLDFMAFFGSETEMDIGVYDMESNSIEYFGKPYVDESMTLIKASCALLLLAKPYKWQGKKYFDAGLVDMISIEQALRHGCDKVVVISTKEKGYRRKPAPKWQLWLAKLIYKDPVIVNNLRDRHLNYQKQWDIVDRLEEEGKAIVIRPQKDMGVTRYTTNPRKLRPWFQLGYDETLANLEAIETFCGIHHDQDDLAFHQMEKSLVR